MANTHPDFLSPDVSFKIHLSHFRELLGKKIFQIGDENDYDVDGCILWRKVRWVDRLDQGILTIVEGAVQLTSLH